MKDAAELSPGPRAAGWDMRDVEMLERIQRRVLWLATYLVHHANFVRERGAQKVGGHQASSSSVVTLLTALYFRYLSPGDLVSIKPHASPIFHAIQYLRGLLPQAKLATFRQFGGLQAYPSRTKDLDGVDFSTGSVGLGAVAPVLARWCATMLRITSAALPAAPARDGRSHSSAMRSSMRATYGRRWARNSRSAWRACCGLLISIVRVSIG